MSVLDELEQADLSYRAEMDRLRRLEAGRDKPKAWADHEIVTRYQRLACEHAPALLRLARAAEVVGRSAELYGNAYAVGHDDLDAMKDALREIGVEV